MEDYAQWIKKIDEAYNALTDKETLINDAYTHFKFEGFDLNEIARQMTDFNVNRIIKLLVIFHVRGTKVTKIKKSIKSDYLTEFENITSGIKDNAKSSRTALTLSRISLATPAISFQVAFYLKEKMNKIAVDFLGEYAPIACNAIPALVKLDISDRDKYWKLYIISCVHLSYITATNKKDFDFKDALIKANNYALLSYEGSKDLLISLIKAADDLVTLKPTDNYIIEKATETKVDINNIKPIPEALVNQTKIKQARKEMEKSETKA